MQGSKQACKQASNKSNKQAGKQTNNGMKATKEDGTRVGEVCASRSGLSFAKGRVCCRPTLKG